MLIISVALAALWSAVLAGLDLGTVPPRAISREQLRASQSVLVGRLVAKGGDRIVVERVLRGQANRGDKLLILNLSSVEGLQEGRSYVFALKPFGRDYEVTTLPGQKVSPLVYPADAATLEEIKQWIR